MPDQKKTVIVTGASSGIGRATAMRFANDGYNVVLNGTNADALDKVAGETLAVALLLKPFQMR